MDVSTHSTRPLTFTTLSRTPAYKSMSITDASPTLSSTAPAPETHLQQSIDWIQHKILDKADSVLNFSIELLPTASSPSSHSSTTAASTTAAPRNRVIGAVGAVRGPEVGYMLHPDFWGQGYATEALAAFIPMFWTIVPPAGAPRPSTSPSTSTASESAPQALDPRVALASAEQTPPPPTSAPLPSSSPSAAPAQSPAPATLQSGHDYIEAILDAENFASARVLEKCGFTLWSRTQNDFESPMLGLRSTIVYRLARPGTALGVPPVISGSEQGCG